MSANFDPTLDILDDATGGDCTSVGIWNPATKTCTLTQDVFEEIVIWDNGVTLDCDGHTVTSQTPGTGAGVRLPSVMGVTVKNCRVTAFYWGFYLDYSDGNTLERNSATSNYLGFYVLFSDGNTLERNRAEGNDYGFRLEGSDGNTLKSNRAYDNDYNGFVLDHSGGNTLERNRAKGNDGNGFLIYYSVGNRLRSNRAWRNDYGFHLYDSDVNLLYENAGRRNTVFDAYQEAGSTGNQWIHNRFGTTGGIP